MYSLPMSEFQIDHVTRWQKVGCVGWSVGVLAWRVCAGEITHTWPQYRGPEGQGLGVATHLPHTWSETNHVLWMCPLPGLGHSSPVVADQRVWLTSATDKGRQRHVLCVDLQTGALVRDRVLYTCDEPERCHNLNSFATPTPVLEDGRVYVTFGKEGTACLAAESGETLWERRDLPVHYFDVGVASSPILYQDKLILTCDGQADDVRYVIALDKLTGKTVWRTDSVFADGKNPAYTHSSGVPLVVPVAGQAQLISPGAHGVRAYDLQSGRELWQVKYGGWSVVPRPVYGNDLVYVCNGVVKPVLLAIRPDGAHGDVTASAVVWQTNQHVPNMPSPLLIDNRLYTLTATRLSCLNATTGAVIWSETIPGQHMASPVAADKHIFLFNMRGGGAVVAQGDKFQLVATNTLQEGCMASPAVVDNSLIVRTRTRLYRLGER